MLMNKNTITFNNFLIEIQKITYDQYSILKYVFMTIEKKQVDNMGYFISIDLFRHMSDKELKLLFKKNIEITVTNKKNKEWFHFNVINDIKIKDSKIYFRAANIVREIILDPNSSSGLSFLKYILFYGIRHKQTLLLLDHIMRLKEFYFDISVDDLKEILELAPNQYTNFSTLRRSVIDKAIIEINNKTSLSVEYVISQKERKKVTRLTFKYFTRERQI